ncbi:Na/Pi symporter [Candidatus Undinarchaeota archaeon]
MGLNLSFTKSRLFKIFVIFLGIYLFVCALTGFKDSWVMLFAIGGEESMARRLIGGVVQNPFAALFAGILATSLIQSSSATVAITIAMVAAGGITISQSVPLIMGANIGTTVTSTIVSMAYAFRKAEFAKVVPATLVHDMFKFYNVAIFFVLELSFQFLSRIAASISSLMEGMPLVGGFLNGFPDFLDILTAPVVNPMISVIINTLGETPSAALMLGVASFILLAYGLKIMSDAVRDLTEAQADHLLKKAFKNPKRSLLVGFSLCWILQSSSVATSLVIPFVAAGVVKLKEVYHYAMGAALGTTCDAGQIISYLKFGIIGLSVGLVHILLNFFGVIIFSFVPVLKDLPLTSAEKIGDFIVQSKRGAILFIFLVVSIFYILPLLVIILGGGL